MVQNSNWSSIGAVYHRPSAAYATQPVACNETANGFTPRSMVVVIARSARDYVGMLARKPERSDGNYARYRALIEEMGYDMTELRRGFQRWPETEPVASKR
jgi:hypothetical protein